ncbi:monocarboxylate permease-like protein [Arthroderma uncinatum]|uniref:monocarboxylate permease-like protein n=1 Tax=Arthroderma uncinatum TaxID=74035 RepID=UPI00144A6622|nr:monocarboxylate permease-like protein [Arthroderma uncinatum]KAF3483909.1 monocarboxylate permease-like protein [Arthroderma uncinatum]
MDNKSKAGDLKGYLTDDIEQVSPTSETSPWKDLEDSYPEGGAVAWLTVAGASASLFVSFGWVNCVGIFQSYYHTHQLKAYTESEVAWISSLQVFFMLFCGPFFGTIFDNWGHSYLLMVGTALHVGGLMLANFMDTYAGLLLSQAVCSGLGASMVFYPSVTCVATWFFQRRAAALGPVVAGSSLGGVIFPIMVIRLIPKWGFGWTMRACAFLILCLLIFTNFTLKSRLPPSKRPWKLADMTQPMKEPAFLALSAAIFFYYWGMFLPVTYIVVAARKEGMSQNLANYMVPILNAASILGRTIPNIIADKVGRFNIMIMMCTLTTTLILGLWMIASDNLAMILFAVFFGISSGSGVGLTPALVAQVSPIKEIGIRTGLAFAIGSLAGLSGSPIGGQIIEASGGSLRYMMVFAGVNCTIGTGFFVLARIILGGMKMAKV